MRRKGLLRRRSATRAFTLIEILVGVLIVGILMNVALPSYLLSVYNARRGVANANARTLGTCVQAKAITGNAYDTTLSDYTTDMGGAIPLNPCTGTTTGYTITASGNTATVTATAGTNCGSWSPTIYSVTL